MTTDDQRGALGKARESAQRLKMFADKARSMGLTVLESHLRDASISCQAGADFQERALGDNLSNQTEKTVVDNKPRARSRANCSRCGTWHDVDSPCPDQDVTKSPMIEGGEAQADRIAAAMKRKGLV